MKGAIFTGLLILVVMVVYFKWVHKKVTGADSDAAKGYGYDAYGYDAYGYDE